MIIIGVFRILSNIYDGVFWTFFARNLHHRCLTGSYYASDQNHLRLFPTGIYLLKVNNRNTRARFEICTKLTIKTPERCHSRRSDDVIYVVLVYLLLTLNIFHTLFWCFYCLLWICNYGLAYKIVQGQA